MTGPGLLDRLERVWPVGLFFNAVFQKEMRAAGRRAGTYVARTIYGGLTFIVVGFFLLVSIAEFRGGGGDLQQLQNLAPLVAVILSWFGLFMLAFIAPVMTVPAFMDERRKRSLAVLMTTPLTSAQVVCAKLASQTIQLLILALLGLPVVLALRVFGGVPASYLLQSNAILLSAALLVSTLGLRYSLHRDRADVAIVAAFATAAVIQMGPMLLIAIFQWFGAGPTVLFVLPVVFSPFALAAMTADLLGGMGGPPWATANIWLGNTLYNLAWALVFVLETIFRLRRVLRLEGAGVEYLKPRRRARRARKSAVPTAEAGPARAEGQPPPPGADRDAREVGDRPVLWRELRQATFRTRRAAILSTLGLCAVLILVYARVEMTEEPLHFVITTIAMLLILLRAAASSTAAFTAEREARTLETLLCTPLSAGEIVVGKFLGALRRQWYIPAFLFGHLLLSVAIGVLHPIILFHMALVVTGSVVFLLGTGIFLGLVIRRATTASVANICVGLALWAGVPFVAIVLHDFFAPANSEAWNAAARLIFDMHPLGLAMSAIEGALHNARNYGSPGLGTVDLLGFTMNTCLSTTGYLLAALAVLILARRVFPSWAGRNS